MAVDYIPVIDYITKTLLCFLFSYNGKAINNEIKRI